MGREVPATSYTKMAVGRVVMLMVAVMALVSLDGKWVGAQVHHVVGGDRGWDPANDLASWSKGRNFNVGDKIWFTYSVAQGIIVELKTKEEFESCDVVNPIRMYTEGLDGVVLDGVGIRYFAGSKTEYCNSGLKLHVEVMPQQSLPVSAAESATSAIAAGPIPSGSSQLSAVWALFISGLSAFCMGF